MVFITVSAPFRFVESTAASEPIRPRQPINAVIPAQAGIHFAFDRWQKIKMDSRFRGNDGLKI
jgi:hypothetical protein